LPLNAVPGIFYQVATVWLAIPKVSFNPRRLLPISAFALFKPIRVLIPEAFNVRCNEQNLCVDDFSQLDAAVPLVNDSKAYLETQWRLSIGEPSIIFCSTEKCQAAFGLSQKAGFTLSRFIDWKQPLLRAKAEELAAGCVSDEAIAKRCFEFVRDAIKHSWDYRLNPVTCKVSDVLIHGTGYCYAKSHLLAALLRANQIPADFVTSDCHQPLRGDRC